MYIGRWWILFWKLFCTQVWSESEVNKYNFSLNVTFKKIRVIMMIYHHKLCMTLWFRIWNIEDQKCSPLAYQIPVWKWKYCIFTVCFLIILSLIVMMGGILMDSMLNHCGYIGNDGRVWLWTKQQPSKSSSGTLSRKASEPLTLTGAGNTQLCHCHTVANWQHHHPVTRARDIFHNYR